MNTELEQLNLSDKQHYYCLTKYEGWDIYQYLHEEHGNYFYRCGSDVAYDISVFSHIKPCPLPATDLE